MNIGILGYESNNSWTPLMCKALNEQGHFVTQFSIDKVKQSLSPYKVDDVLKFKKPYSLRTAIYGWQNRIDLLIVSQSYMHFYNDLPFPVFYYHTELTSPFTVKGATHLMMKLPEMYNWMHSYDPWEWYNVKFKFYCFPMAFPPHYTREREKDIHLSFIGEPSNMFDRMRDWVWEYQTTAHNKIKSYFDRHNIGEFYVSVDDVPADHPTYNDVQSRSQFMMLTAFNGTYIGRRHMECLASATIPLIWLENDTAANIFHNLGFRGQGEEKQNCYFWRRLDELQEFKKLEYDKEIADNGYELLVNNHTPGHRALKILKVIEQTCQSPLVILRENKRLKKKDIIKDVMVSQYVA